MPCFSIKLINSSSSLADLYSVKILLKYNLTLTGKNVSNAIRAANDPMAKVMKNCQLEAQYHYQKKLSAAKEKDSPLIIS
jgi:hypothetical protein